MPTAKARSSDINPGTLAGAVVGAFFAGAILVLMAAYIFSRRHKTTFTGRGSMSESPSSTRDRRSGRTSHPAIVHAAWERFLQQPVDDDAMALAVKSIKDQVAMHVANVYVKKNCPISNSMLNAMAVLDTKLLPGALPELMMDSNMQLITIKRCIAYILTKKMMPGDSASDVLLPLHLATLPRTIDSGTAKDKETIGE